MAKKIKLSGKKRTELYEYLIKRDGAICQGYERSTHKANKLDIDKIDPSKGYTKRNIQLLCRSCNCKKNPRGKGRAEVEFKDQVVGSETYQLSQRYKQMFGDAVRSLIEEYGPLEWNELLDAATHLAGCSHQAGNRYLKQVTSIVGELERKRKDGRVYVDIKPERSHNGQN